MQMGYWHDWYVGWGWLLWYGLFLLMFANIGSIGYTYSAHRKIGNKNLHKSALEILNERYARGEINHDEYEKIKKGIST